MIIVMMACTARGFETMRRCAGYLNELFPQAQILQDGRCAWVPGFENRPKLSELTAEWFKRADALVFISATGIAVRCIAPFVRDKFSDPAVLVIDENARFVIPLLSGHAGGANRLCGLIAEKTGALPVVTTATDGRGLFAVDVFAAENGLLISDRKIAKQISARLLAGKKISIFTDTAHGADGLSMENAMENAMEQCRRIAAQYGEGIEPSTDRGKADIILSVRRLPEDPADALYLIPRILTLGIGCRKGTPAGQIHDAVTQVLKDRGVFAEALAGIASIDLKKEEPGLLGFAAEWKLPASFYTAEELRSVPGNFSSSPFVQSITGVDNVCERSAVLLAGRDGKLLVNKQRGEGVTVAVGSPGFFPDF